MLAACASGPLSGREKGALAGGAIGAGAGAIVGNQVHHHTAAGAAIGGAAGALGGAIIGDQSDAAAQDRYRYDRYDR
jgi:uncharacterized protein YcfJ